MVVIDWIALVIVVLSALIGLKRGFTREVLSVVTWVLAVVVAMSFSDRLSLLLVQWIQTDSWRLATAFGILFVLTLIVGAMLNHVLSEFVRMIGLGGLDRTLGVLFGVLRGAIVVVLLLVLARLLTLDEQWRDGFVMPMAEPVVQALGEWAQQMLDRVFNNTPSLDETLILDRVLPEGSQRAE
jgi:membrane protein required for colicin V production